MFGLDWAWGTISPASMHAVNAGFACRYHSWDRSKNLSPSEAKSHTKGGIDDVVVWETTANRAAQGFSAGQSDARAAMIQASACGKPATRPIFFAVDFDATGAQVFAYFKGVNSILGKRRTGAYGGYRVIKALFDAGLIAFGWQTYAWSGGAWDHRAHLQQYSNGHRVAGVSCDYNRSTAADFGQWRVGQTGPPAPPKDPMWFARPDERQWIREFNALNNDHTALGHCARMRLMGLMNERRKLIWKRSQGHGGKDWNIWHRRQRYHLLATVTRHTGPEIAAPTKLAA